MCSPSCCDSGGCCDFCSDWSGCCSSSGCCGSINCCQSSPCCDTNGCGPVCCYRRSSPPSLPKIDDYRWFERCTTSSCVLCMNKYFDCNCISRRNRHIVEALSCLFNIKIPQMMSILFKLAFQQNEPMKRFPRDRRWDVMEHVKVPYTELNDLEIYDSMYDRCGLPIDVLNEDNIYKIVRLMFLISILTVDQQKYLLRMLKRLNSHAHCPVDLDLLLQTLEDVQLQELMCSIRDEEPGISSLFTARQCDDLCQLYQKVVTIDKHAVKRRRKRIKYSKKSVKSTRESGQAEESASVREAQLNRQFCERKQPDMAYSGETPSVSTPNSGRKRSSTYRSHSSSRNPSRSSKIHS